MLPRAHRPLLPHRGLAGALLAATFLLACPALAQSAGLPALSLFRAPGSPLLPGERYEGETGLTIDAVDNYWDCGLDGTDLGAIRATWFCAVSQRIRLANRTEQPVKAVGRACLRCTEPDCIRGEGGALSTRALTAAEQSTVLAGFKAWGYTLDDGLTCTPIQLELPAGATLTITAYEPRVELSVMPATGPDCDDVAPGDSSKLRSMPPFRLRHLLWGGRGPCGRLGGGGVNTQWLARYNGPTQVHVAVAHRPEFSVDEPGWEREVQPGQQTIHRSALHIGAGQSHGGLGFTLRQPGQSWPHGPVIGVGERVGTSSDQLASQQTRVRLAWELGLHSEVLFAAAELDTAVSGPTFTAAAATLNLALPAGVSALPPWLVPSLAVGGGPLVRLRPTLQYGARVQVQANFVLGAALHWDWLAANSAMPSSWQTALLWTLGL